MSQKVKCDKCDKEASCHITLIKNGEVIHKHYCEEHAKVAGVNDPKCFAFLDSGIIPLVENTQMTPGQCKKCGYTYKSFEKTGLLGCGECYETYKDILKIILKKIHPAVQHVGKAPKILVNIPVLRKHIEVLNQRIQQAIEEEKYEDAARIRDEIKGIQEKLKCLGAGVCSK